ncbi:hypothetical protein GCM10010411_76160 [Actinomadura fulvescens]|uniref:Uncharacterized protein n=1 Tax=Actinomadura fulvescens TaxID=46160 RepID=A0ABP6CXU3_9ACTN
MSIPLSPETLARARQAQLDQVAKAVDEGRLAPDIAQAMTDPHTSRWIAAHGFAVVDRWEDLRGPATGTLDVSTGLQRGEIPAQLPLDDKRLVREVYRAALASADADLQIQVLNPDLLIGMWRPGLTEPSIMRVWEQRFPQLPRTGN